MLDEPTSALDGSVQGVILHVLADLRERLGMSDLFVSHDLNLVRLLTDRVLVMYLGKIVESGPSEMVFDRPEHPYTRALVSAVPALEPDGRRHVTRPAGETQNPIRRRMRAGFTDAAPTGSTAARERCPCSDTRRTASIGPPVTSRSREQ